MPANLKGLNIVQPQQAPSDSQDLLSGQSFPDISAQLDLWTNLTFDMDENSPARNDEQAEDENEAKLHASINSENPVHDGHADVPTAANLGSKVPRNSSQSNAAPQLQQFDLNALLSGIGFDPYANLTQQANPSTLTPSLAQLLALHSQNQLQGGIPSPFSQYAVPSSTTYNPISSPPPPQSSLASASSPVTMPATISATSEEPQAKRSRTRKTSVSSSDTFSPDVQSVTFAAAEDKRRRNTAASARFRLKKKEREAALEGKAKELEARVSELERECEGLRRENGWLKGLVVGVTGAAQAPVVTSSSSPLTSVQLANLATATSSSRGVRDGSSN